MILSAPIFSGLAASASGLSVFRTWMDAISDNVANMNTVRPTSESAFQARFVVAESVAGAPDQPGGARVAGIEFGSAEGRVVYQPEHPLADAEGLVRYPSVDLGDQMTQLMIAQRGYQANLSVIDRARDAYIQALSLGR